MHPARALIAVLVIVVSGQAHGAGPGRPASNGQAQSTADHPTPDQANHGPGDQDRALNAVKGGQAMPLSIIENRWAIGGRVIDANLGTLGGRLIYMLTILTPKGVLEHIQVDARTGERL